MTEKLPDFPVTGFSRIRRLRQPDLCRKCKLSDQSLVIGALSGLDSAPGGKVGCWGRLFKVQLHRPRAHEYKQKRFSLPISNPETRNPARL